MANIFFQFAKFSKFFGNLFVLISFSVKYAREKEDVLIGKDKIFLYFFSSGPIFSWLIEE